jgi:hypothetical protein
LPVYGIEEYLKELWLKLADLTPSTLGAVIVIVIGWVLGRLVGSGVSKVLEKAGIDGAMRRTIVGKTLERSGIKVARLFNLLIRWLVYLVAILAAVNILNITSLNNFMTAVVQYLPSFIVGVFIMILGTVVADFVGNSVRALGREAGVRFSFIVGDGLRLLLYFVAVVTGLSVMKIDVSILQIFANALAWGAAAAFAIAFGLGFKDTVAKNSERWINALTSTAEKVEETVKVQTLEERVRELESSLVEHTKRIEIMEKEKEIKIQELTAPTADIYSKLLELAGEKGDVFSVYGGYQVRILDPTTFPWFEVLAILSNASFDVWISKENESFVIKGKPPSAS